jgi:23S rRNA (adenine2030-N6)-methyltransferase
MNYRHAYHAGNFADCVKHAVLVWLLRAMQRKDTPLLVLDTHAGVGHYDLASDAAERTGEWRQGIARLLGGTLPHTLTDYLGVVQTLGLYPGSPAILRAIMRPTDRLVACELHAEDARALRRLYAGDRQVSVHCRDGYEALGAFLPPPERRALVLVDPPYEEADEFDTLAARLGSAWSRFPAGVFVAWYPIKHRAPVRAFHDALRAGPVRDVIAAEFLLREALDPARLNGCGVLVINPPWRFDDEVPPILDALLSRLADGDPGAGLSLHRLADE